MVYKLNEEDLHGLLQELRSFPKETEWVEFKKAKNNFDSNKLGKYFSALSNEANLKNKSCGWLVFGIDDTRNIVGTRYKSDKGALDKLKSNVAHCTNNNITFIEIYELMVSDKRVIMFQIPAALKGIPTSWKGHWYGRDGESLCALNIQEIEHIRNQGQPYDWSAQICEKATINDLEPEAILKAKKEFKQKNKHLTKEVDTWDDVTFLNKAKITINGKITNAAIVLLAKDESGHFLSPSVAQITWILKDENNVEKDYEHFGPPFILNVEKVFAKIRNIKYRYLPNETLFPTEINQYDPWVIREALHNCIAHQDYDLHGRINVVEKPDELIFTNLGSFIPGEVEDVISQDSPQAFYRNPFLAQAMVNFNMIDTIGSGIKKMFQKQRDRFFPLPSYDVSQERVEVRIAGRVLNEDYTQMLIKKRELDLFTIILLDKVQKQIKIDKKDSNYLKSKGLVEGRYPNLFVSSHIASVTVA